MESRAVLPLLARGTVVALALAAGSAHAQFVDRTAFAGLAWNQTTWGAAFADFDNDGWLDLYAGHHVYLPRLFWNERDGTFNANVHPQPWSGPMDRHGTLAVPLDADERLDLFVTHGGDGGAGTEPNELYRNEGGGTFLRLPGALGMTDPAGRTRCASAADHDGDLRVDLWVGKAPDAGAANALFRNGGNVFTDVAAVAGLAEAEGAAGGIWGDVDDDGDPDLLVGGEEFPRPTRLWRNDGGGFTDVSAWFTPPLPVVSGADWGDCDGDGDLDLAVCDGMVGLFDTWADGDSLTFFFNTRYADTGVDGLTVPSNADTARAVFRYRAFPDNARVFLGPDKVNPPAGIITLTDAYVGEPVFAPGVDLGIFVWRTSPGAKWEIRCSTPNVNFDVFDGWLTDGFPISGVTPQLLDDPAFVPGAPRVWRNDGGSFAEVSAGLGLPAAMLNPRDISWVDYDNDGDLDLHVVDMGTSAAPNAPDALFRNDGGSFADVTAEEGVAGGAAGMGDGAVWGDVDRDGDPDLYVAQGTGPLTFSANAPALYLENAGARGASLQLDLVGAGDNAAAVGARVTVWTGTRAVTRRVAANAWRGFQDPLRLHVGLGEAAIADSVRIAWPSGLVETHAGVAPGIHTFREGVSPVGAPVPGARSDVRLRLHGPAPQPARGPQVLEILGAVGPVRVEFFDVAGRRVRVLRTLADDPLPVPVSWDGRADDGRRVPAGVYPVRVTDPQGRTATARCIRVD